MENRDGYRFIKTDEIKADNMVIASKCIKYSKLELAWRVGITVAVIVLIGLSV